MKRLFKPLYIQVLIGTAAGIALGLYAPDLAAQMKPLADGFVKLLKMLAAPIIFATVVVGIGRAEDIKSVGRIGAKALIWFEAATTVALLIGLVVANFIRPGHGMNVNLASLDATPAAGFAKTAQAHGLVPFFLHIIPHTFVGAFADGDILQVVFISVLFGVALSRLEAGGELVLGVMKGLYLVSLPWSCVLPRWARLALWVLPSGAMVLAPCCNWVNYWWRFMSPVCCSSLLGSVW